MTTIPIIEYYDATENRNTRQDLLYSLNHLNGEKIAVDCGCGAGSDIAFLRKNNFQVHAFDTEEEAIRRCKDRFKSDPNVFLSVDSFSSFKFPNASLIVADASLFFCPENEFDSLWMKITNALKPNGIFCGSFLGPNDTMASPECDEEYWKATLILKEQQIKEKLANFEILKWTEHNTPGKAPNGKLHNWHIYSTVAKKLET